MIIVKLVVLLLLIGVRASVSEYCDVCPNHTLCKYPAGPSQECIGYDTSALLTRAEGEEIVARVNEHRARVAQGLASRLPPAANMWKISWSDELARSAQRWADQCDPATRPDNHDTCRNLAKTAVGQNIATIFGPAPGLNVKSFIDTWYMQISDFTGSVTLYNQSTNRKTKYFTQLIWAETSALGCGKARFYVESRNTVVERLVCNFAPRGNILGKPMYAVGFAGTQCRGRGAPDRQQPALCTRALTPPLKGRKIPVLTSPATSLLRILNLSNNSIKYDIDPIRNEYKQMNGNEIEGDHRNQKIRHVFNNSFAAGISPFLPRPPHWNISDNSRRFPLHQHQHDKGHSRVYHGHEYTDNFPQPLTGALNFRKYDYTTVLLDSYTKNLRKFNQDNKCTRQGVSPEGYNGGCNVGFNSPVPRASNECTRGQASDCFTSPVVTPYVLSNEGCSCSTQAAYRHADTCNRCCESTCPPTTAHCCQTEFLIHNANHYCPNSGRRIGISIDDTAASRSPQRQYYDQFPNLAMKSGDSSTENGPFEIFHKKAILVKSTPHDDEQKTSNINVWQQYDTNNEQVKSKHKVPKYLEEHEDYSYGSFDSRKRYRRESDDISDRLLWKLGDYNTVNPKQLKSLRYTLLRTKNMDSSIPNVVTEPITFNVRSPTHHEDDMHLITEKYVLSFDELMRLRNAGKLNARRQEGRARIAKSSTSHSETTREGKATSKEIKTIKNDSNNGVNKDEIKKKNRRTTAKEHRDKLEIFSARRHGARRDNAESQNTSTTEEKPDESYTINTQFSPVSYCTRKITCTWTKMRATDSDGNTLIPNGPNDNGYSGGKKTPPGYVEGCSRTSTCTRDYIERNKISTIPTTLPGEMITPIDEDYCEKRALNVKRRNSEDEDRPVECVTNNKEFQSDEKNINNRTKIDIIEGLVRDHYDPNNNHKLINFRMKRQNRRQTKCKICNDKTKNNYNNPLMSYGDLYYLVLSKLMKSAELKKSGKCACNGSVKQNRIRMNTLLLVIVFNFIHRSYSFVLN